MPHTHTHTKHAKELRKNHRQCAPCRDATTDCFIIIRLMRLISVHDYILLTHEKCRHNTIHSWILLCSNQPNKPVVGGAISTAAKCAAYLAEFRHINCVRGSGAHPHSIHHMRICVLAYTYLYTFFTPAGRLLSDCRRLRPGNVDTHTTPSSSHITHYHNTFDARLYSRSA